MTKSKKRRVQSLIVLVTIIIALFFAMDIVGLVAFRGTYSTGTRTGQVMKLSERGVFWKTWEGSLGLTQSGAYVQRWDFSLDRRDPRHDEILAQLRLAQERGTLIHAVYRQRYGKRRWHGKTSYFIESIRER